MTEPITPNQLRRLFPGASKSVLARNPLEVDTTHPPVTVELEKGSETPVTPSNAATGRFIIWGAPVGKPRMTQRDKWKKRPCVLRYRAWADHARDSTSHLPETVASLSWIAYFPMPKSWSDKKRLAMRCHPHQQKPDRDNVDKAILDALFRNDATIATGHLEKRWDDGFGPRVELFISEP